MYYQFQEKSKFALLMVNSAYTDLSASYFQLRDGTRIMSEAPTLCLNSWEKQLGSIRLDRLRCANLNLLVEQSSENPTIFDDDVSKRLVDKLSLLFEMLHLRVGIKISEHTSANLLVGFSLNGTSKIFNVCEMPRFYRTHGGKCSPITRNWLEECVRLRDGAVVVNNGNTHFKRVRRGLIALLKGTKEKSGQDRLHQFVRSLDALVLPDKGKTKGQFKHRCQTFAGASEATRDILGKAYDMRSTTEHLHQWDRDMWEYLPDRRDDEGLRMTRQIEHLAYDAYSRLLREPDLREHFRTDEHITAFWKLSDCQQRKKWGKPVNIVQGPTDHD